MRVLHLSTHDLRGGAARSAWRLHQGLVAIGADSRVLVRTKHSNDDRVAATDDGTLAAWHEQIATPWLQRRLPANSPWFTTGAIHADVSSHPWVQEADVLHLHWVAEWLSASAIAGLAALRKPIVWTFHDLWAVTGGYHYPGRNNPQDDAWQTGASLPEELASIARIEFEHRLALLAPLPLQIISPSRWLAAQSQQSHIGQKWQTQVIPYGIDITIFRPGDVSGERKRWSVPKGSICLLFGCASLNEERKGFGALKQALALAMNNAAFAQAAASGSVQLLLFGAESPPLSDLPIQAQHLGVIRSESDMASVYQAADVYLCPTLEDNLPNTVLESLACGTPVVGFATGGVPDMVTHDTNGLLAPCGDVQALSEHLIRIVIDTACRHRLQQEVRLVDLTGFALQTQAQRVQDLYHDLLARETTPAPTVARSPSQPMPPWLMQAAVEALQRAGERETVLKEKLTKAKAKAAKPEAKPEVKRRWWQ